MAADDYTMRTMTRDELDLAIAWAAAEGWNPGLYDADCFYAADPTGFLIGLLGDEAIATLSVVKYGESFGFLGFYIVKPEFRSQGYGLRLWQAGMVSLRGRTVGLDGVVAQQDNYLKSGFKLAHRNIRYQGISDGENRLDTEFNIVPLSSLPLDSVIEYDRAFFPDDRAAFLRCWLTQPDSYGIGVLHQRSLAGYGVIRACQEGYKIGPLFADTPLFAEAILQSLKAYVHPGDTFYLDVPEVNPHAVKLAEKHQMISIFETARMYTTRAPELPLKRLFGITTFELG
ncbi:MAG: GNAT family N-acetyltransferase [Leptolyngbyaceae cyanobacterium]